MQDGEFTFRIPPFGGNFREFLDLGRIEASGLKDRRHLGS
jgi:hypothetical protein